MFLFKAFPIFCTSMYCHCMGLCVFPFLAKAIVKKLNSSTTDSDYKTETCWGDAEQLFGVRKPTHRSPSFPRTSDQWLKLISFWNIWAFKSDFDRPIPAFTDHNDLPSLPSNNSRIKSINRDWPGCASLRKHSDQSHKSSKRTVLERAWE